MPVNIVGHGWFKSFAALVLLRWQLIANRGLLILTTSFFEYLGSVVNYVAVGLAL